MAISTFLKNLISFFVCDCLNYYYDGDYFVIVVNVYYQEHRQKTSKLSQANVIADDMKNLKTVHFIKLVR